MTELTETTWQEAEDAMRDILFLYRDLTEYLGFSGDHTTGAFRPWRWLSCESVAGWGSDDDVRLLQEGSAVALIVHLIDTWEQADGAGVERFVDAVGAGRFDHLPLARAAIEAGVAGTDLPEFGVCADAVYREYVLKLFAGLAGSTRPVVE